MQRPNNPEVPKELLHDSPFGGDPLHGVHTEKSRIRFGAYAAITAFVLINYFVLDMNWLQTGVTLVCCAIVATVAIEYAFARFIRLRKQGVYPSLLAMELGATRDFALACEKSVRLVAALMGTERVVLAWADHRGDRLATVATAGFPSDDLPVPTPLAWAQPGVRQAIEQRRVVVAGASEGDSWLPRSNGRRHVACVPLLSSDRLVGLLVLVARQESAALTDKRLLTGAGLAIGLTLDNLRHTSDLREIAIRDELTQLFNRRYFFEQLEKGVGAAGDFDRPVGLIILDVDKLKLINDTYGHDVGDKVLANLGRVLSNRVRDDDVVARIGGDEFAVLMRDTGQRGALAMARRLEKFLQRRPIYEGDGLELTLTISCGVAGFPWSGDDVAEIMRCADARMYEAKARRKATESAGPPTEATQQATARSARASG